MLKRGGRRHQILLAVGNPPVILTPSHFRDVSCKMRPSDMMMDTDLRSADAREKRLGVIRASAFVRICPFVIYALRQKAIVERVPMRGFVSVNRGAEFDNGGDFGDAGRFGIENFGDGPAALFASDYGNLALAILVFGQATIAAVLFVIGRLQVTAEITPSTETVPDTVSPCSPASASRILWLRTNAVLY